MLLDSIFTNFLPKSDYQYLNQRDTKNFETPTLFQNGRVSCTEATLNAQPRSHGSKNYTASSPTQFPLYKLSLLQRACD